MPNFLKELIDIFSIKNNPSIIKKGDHFLIRSAFDYTCDVFFDEDYMYFKHKDYNFCVKRTIKQTSKIRELDSFINYTGLFNLSANSFSKCVSRVAFTVDWDSYANCIKFNDHFFNLLEFKTKRVNKQLKRVKISDLTLLKPRRYPKFTGYFFADTVFEMADYSYHFGNGNFSRKSDYESELMMYKYNSNSYGNNYSFDPKLKRKVYSAQKKIDFNRLKLIGDYSKLCIPIRLNGNLALFGIAENRWLGEPDKLINFIDFYKQLPKKRKHRKSDFSFLKEYFIDNEPYSKQFVCYVPQKDNTLKVYNIKATKEALLRFENLLIDKIDNENNFYKYPSPNVRYSLENMGVIDIHAEPTKEELDLYKMMEI